jgi:hypothetical protein
MLCDVTMLTVSVVTQLLLGQQHNNVPLSPSNMPCSFYGSQVVTWSISVRDITEDRRVCVGREVNTEVLFYCAWRVDN